MTYFETASDLKQNNNKYLSLDEKKSQGKKELAMKNLKEILSDRNLSSDEIRDERLERLFRNQSS